MVPAAILYEIAGSPALEGARDEPGICAICAMLSNRTMLFDRWQGANFTDQNKIRTWGATLVCEACMWAHSWVPPPGFPAQEEGKKGVNLRLYSHLWGEATGYQYANKATKPIIREWIRARAESRTERCFCAIADSGQKHVIPWTRVNLPGSRPLVVRFEEQDVTIGDWRLIAGIRDLLTDGVTKDEIAGGDYRLMSWQQSAALLEPFEDEFGSLRGSGWWSLALWLSQRDEDEWKRRDDERRTARAVAKADRGARDGGARRVPRGKPARAAHGFHRGTLTRFALAGQVRAVRTPEGWLFDADSLSARKRLAPRKWTDEEIQTMAEMLPRFNLETIARKLGRSPKAVFHKMTRSGQHRYGQGWLTTGDVAEMTGWSTQTINGWCRSGRIKAHKCPAGLTRRTGPAWWMIAPKEAGRVPRRSADRGRARRAPPPG